MTAIWTLEKSGQRRRGGTWMTRWPQSSTASRVCKLKTVRARLNNQIHCRSRREEAQISDDFAKNQSLLTSAPTILRHALRCRFQIGLLCVTALALSVDGAESLRANQPPQAASGQLTFNKDIAPIVFEH